MSQNISTTNTIYSIQGSSRTIISKKDLGGELTFPDGGFKAYSIVFGSFIGLTGCLGFVNTCGIIETHLKNYILSETDPKSISWIFSIYNFMTFGFSIIVGPIYDRIGSRFILIFGSTILTLGIMLSSISTKVSQFIIFYGIFAGLGTSLVLTPLVGNITHWFYKKRAFSLGIAFMGGGVGGAVFPVMLGKLFPKLGFGWSLRIYGFIVLSLLFFALLITVDRFEELNVSKSNNWKEILSQIIMSIDLTSLRFKLYIAVVLAWLGNELSYILSLTFLPSYAVANGHSESDGFLLIIVLNTCSIPGRFIPGYLADKFGCFNMMCLISLMSTITILVSWLPYPISRKLSGLYTFASIYGFTSGSTLSLAPACIGSISKTKDFGKRYGTAYFILSVLDLVGIPIAGIIIDNENRSKRFSDLVLLISIISFMGTFFSVLSRYFYGGFKNVGI